MSYQFIDESNTTLKIIVGTDELLFKKVYCSTAYEGDYFILNTHELESSKYRQEFKILYTDSTNPSVASASALKTAVDAIIENYAGGGGGGYVPYTGATGDVDLGTHGLVTDFVDFSLTPTASPGTGQIAYNGATGSLAYKMNSSNVQSEIGQTLHAYVHNAEAVTITKGQAVYLYQASGNKASVKLAFNTSDATSAKTFGLAAENISAGQKGFVMCQGSLDGLNTGAYTAGDTLYLGSTAGTYTATKPYAPNHLVYIGVVERANAGNGQIYVRPQNGYELDELHNVQAQSPSNKDVLYYDSASSQWKTTQIATILGYTPANASTAVTSVTGTSPIVSSGGTTPAISLPVATSSANGYLSSTDWSTFNGKQAALVSGTNIKTVNSTSLLGSGDVAVQPTLVSGTNIKTVNSTTLLGSGDIAVQATLVSGTNIKTVNSTSLLGSGNVAVGTVTSVGGTGTTAGLSLSGSVTTSGNLTLSGTLSTPISTINDSTTVGQNLVKLVNPSAITFLRVNADNSVSTLDAATFRTAIGAGTSSTNGTVTSVAALTLGTTGTDLSSTVANGTTTPAITLNVPTASATNRGALSSADWSTFNGKQNALTLTTTGTSGAATLVGSTLNIPQYSGGGGGGSTKSAWLTTVQALGSDIKSESICFPHPSTLATTTGITTQNLTFWAVYVPQATTITGVLYWITNGNSVSTVTTGFNGFGLYTLSGSTLTRVAVTADAVANWRAGSANSVQKIPFNATYSASAGLYYIGMLACITGTLPSIRSMATNNQASTWGTIDFPSNFTCFQVSAQTTMPTTQAMGIQLPITVYGSYLY